MRLIYITNDLARARAAEAAGVDQIMVDLEINGKVARQGHLDTVISRHAPQDVSNLRAIVSKSELLVRVNPIFEGSAEEISDCISRGADRLMLPMFSSDEEVRRFVDLAAGRVRLTLLLETPAALARLPAIIDIPGIESVHLGLNDMHLAFGLDFMFELLSGGLVAHAAGLVREQGLVFGFGGVARLGGGMLPAQLILSEHVRLGSEQVILSRDFGRIFEEEPIPESAAARFYTEVERLRAHVKALKAAKREDLDIGRQRLQHIVGEIAAQRRREKSKA